MILAYNQFLDFQILNKEYFAYFKGKDIICLHDKNKAYRPSFS